jgi:hypothetical protein
MRMQRKASNTRALLCAASFAAGTAPVAGFIASLSGNQVRLQAQGLAGSNYVLQATPHLRAPIPWAPIKTNVADGAGLIQFLATDMAQNPRRFYRIASP